MSSAPSSSLATPGIAELPSLDTSVVPALTQLARAVAADAAWCWIPANAQQKLFSSRRDGEPAVDPATRTPPEEWTPTLDAGRVVEVDQEDRSVLAFPLTHDGARLGVLAVERAVGDPWPKHTEPATKLTAGLIASVVATRRAAEVVRLLATAVEQANETVVVTNRRGSILYANPAFERITGYRREEALGQNPRILKSGKQDAAFYKNLWDTLLRGEVFSGHFVNRKKDGTLYEEVVSISPVRDESGDIVNFVAVKKDVTQEVALERQLAQSQKLEAVGQLASGIAHEINTPTQFVGDNLRFLAESLSDLLGVISGLRPLLDAAKQDGSRVDLVAAADEAIEEADLEFLEDEIPSALQQAQDGVRRIAEIVRAMKEFSHPGSKEKTPVDLNRAIRTATTVSRNVWKYVAELDLQLATDLPDVPCLPDEINQVLLNLITNAAHAIDEARPEGSSELGKITIRTEQLGDAVQVSIADTGTGVPEAARDRIFEPFFTTKEVGRGTGQGLPISRDVVVTKHGGTMDFETELGRGTTFFFRLPTAPPAESDTRAAA